MEAFISLIRHYVTYWVTKLVIILGLPDDLKNQTVQYSAEAASILVSWVVVKYLAPWFRNKIKGKELALILLVTGSLTLMTSCSAVQVEGEFRGPITQVRYQNGKAIIDQKAQQTIISKALRLFSGEKPRDVLTPVFPILHLEK